MSLYQASKQFKKSKKKLVMLTAYDALTAELLEEAAIDMILVGDSVGMVILGYPSTTFVSMDEMIHHAKAVRRGAPKSFIIGDLPLKGVEHGPKHALASAHRFMKEARLDAVKLEWSKTADQTTELLIKNHIPVMGHVGLTPQTVTSKKGFKVQGQKAGDAIRILNNAKAFEDNGVFSVLLECVPMVIARSITNNLGVPTIGIGSGAYCDGQVLVLQDILGMFNKYTPRFVKHYANLQNVMRSAIEKYKREVQSGSFPDLEHSFSMKEEEKERFLRLAP